MKVTKTYQRYENSHRFGVIGSQQPKITYIRSPVGWTYGATGAAQDVILWNLKSGIPVSVLERTSSVANVSCVSSSESDSSEFIKIAVGYEDGWVHVYNVDTASWDSDLECHFRAGRGRVTCVEITKNILVCSADSEINVLDLVSGTGSKLKGHKGLISRTRLLKSRFELVSSAQDSYIKFWDLDKMHCFATLTGHPGPVWDFAISPDDRLLVSGSADQQLRFWKLTHVAQETFSSEPIQPESASVAHSGKVIVPLEQRQASLEVEFLGSIRRFGSRRVHTLLFDQTGSFIVCQSFDRNLEIFHVLDDIAKTKRLKKKIKKAKDKGEDAPTALELVDSIRPVLRITLSAKPASCDILTARPIWKSGKLTENRLQILCSLKNNSIDELEVTFPVGSPLKLQTLSVTKANRSKGMGLRLLNRISAPGHRTPPFACCLTADILGVFTLSRTEAKLWSRNSTACLVTLDWTQAGTDFSSDQLALPSKASAMVLAPGDRHILIGFESGHLMLFDVQSKSVRQIINGAHQGAVRGLVLTNDKKTIISGGSDKQIGFYNFDLVVSDTGHPTLCLVETRPSQSVADQVTCLGVTPNGRLIITGLVNFHVDVHFFDSLKRVHSLYGHAGPITSLDVSSDSRLVITGSADKTVRLWELQFGNCQRRFTTHLEPVTCVRFISHTNLAVSGDMGGHIKQWDVAKLREITTLKGHHGAVTSLAATATNPAVLSGSTKNIQKKKFKNKKFQEDDAEEEETDELAGGLIVSTGRDFSVRLWSESEELLILEEEEQLAREEAEDEELVRSEAVVPGAVPAEASETGLVGRPTPNTRDAADMLMEAIDIYYQECEKKQHPAASKTAQQPHPLMLARGTECPDRFLLSCLTELRAPTSRLGGGGAGLEHAVGAITTDHARRLLPCLASWLSRGLEVELVGRTIRHLVTLHFGLIITSASLRDALQQSREARLSQIGKLKSLIGMNLAGLEYLRSKIEEDQRKSLFVDLLSAREKRIKRQKVKRSRMALILPG